MGLCEKCDCKDKAAGITIDLMDSLPLIRAMLQEDITAAYNGDPARKVKRGNYFKLPFHRSPEHIQDRSFLM